ncbi:MAG: aldehyde dehydrogenase [Ancalomicrobiaceae bacterium]|nr:aldehyde dehydrogenase [Ancalomicrobiaceae bacterium]
MLTVSLLIGGDDRASSDERSFERFNPVSGEIASRAPAATVADARDAAAAAAAAFPAWSALGPSERRDRLLRAAALMEARGPEIAQTMAAEIGATADWSAFNVQLSAGFLREAAAAVTHITGSIIPSDTPGMTAFAMHQPVGVVLGIAPWNAPLIMAVRAIAMPLACGNTVVLKASEVCPATHRLIGDVMAAAGLGAGVVNVVTNAPADAAMVVEALIAHPVVRRVNFTGSTRVGRVIAELSAHYLKPAILELGSKAPLIVLDDADLDEAVKAAAFGAFMNQGQICMSTERIILDDAIADAFAERFAAKAATLIAGDPRRGNTPLGSVISREAAERVSGLVRDAVLKGARILAGGRVNGSLMDATVIDRVTPAMRLYSEESFGPVVALIRVSGVEEAIRVANDTEYGLSSAVFGRDEARAMMVARRLETGICHINGPTVQDEAQMPFGGMKSSGYGRFGGTAAIHEFTELRWITISSKPGTYPI